MGDYIGHFRGQRDFCVRLDTPEEHLNAFKEVHKSVLACPNILRRLRNACVTTVLPAHAKLRRIHTERRTPIPAKTTVAGENDCETNMRV